MSVINCPYCGAEVKEQTPENKVWQCSHCSHSLLVEQSPLVEPIQSTHNGKALISLGAEILLSGVNYAVVGFEVWAHEQGQSTEWRVKDHDAREYYLCMDDENAYLLEDSALLPEFQKDWEALQPNTLLDYQGKQWLVTEQRELRLHQASAGLTSIIAAQETRRYTYLVADNAETLVLVFSLQGVQLRGGFWFDPYEIQKVTVSAVQS